MGRHGRRRPGSASRRGAARGSGAAAVILASCASCPRSAAAAGCPSRAAPPSAPRYATDLNGVAWPDFCFETRGDLEESFFVIGDWGGIFQGADLPPKTAYGGKRAKVDKIDPSAQLLVAEQMKLRANISRPRYVLNVGDNFYWGGVNSDCGVETTTVLDSTLPQWQAVFESVYDGSLLGLPWMGVLGNHDYGGYMFTKGWDQAIAYTWGPGGRWLTPALYWSTKVHYTDFTVDLLFVDSNVNDAFAPPDEPTHNMCSARNNPPNPTCGPTGPTSAWDCTRWFQKLWQDQLTWMPERLKDSTADWRIVVTHFPPEFHREDWRRIAAEYHIDLFVTGHRHMQEVSNRDPEIGGAAWIVSGGGGGIVSEGTPREDGDDDQYGFFDVRISKDQMKLVAISHSGIVRSTTIVEAMRYTTSSTTTATTATKTTSSSSSSLSSPSARASEAGAPSRARDLKEDEEIPYMSNAAGKRGVLPPGAGFAAAVVAAGAFWAVWTVRPQMIGFASGA